MSLTTPLALPIVLLHLAVLRKSLLKVKGWERSHSQNPKITEKSGIGEREGEKDILRNQKGLRNSQNPIYFYHVPIFG
ncbi:MULTISPECIES: hypothetical protein [Cyanophyceae]|uniref:Uncharacterized protein n=1 Tax=Leptolyngbya subtilissima DQ-A4 TaxID=2933933 RepID=A0ABV0K893_9CYAN|nr:hypothetical protein [Nodosilinea sp. FACHB-141]MBD2110670.1 hypothetical protein [Nodosilinea sp. FACHB-141]